MRVGYKAIGVGLSLGGAKMLSKNPGAAILAAFMLVGAGYMADRYLLPACSSCGGALHAIDGALSLLGGASARRSS